MMRGFLYAKEREKRLISIFRTDALRNLHSEITVFENHSKKSHFCLKRLVKKAKIFFGIFVVR